MSRSLQPRRFASSTLTIKPGRVLQRTAPLYLKLIVDACPSGVVVLDETGTVVQINGAWRHFAIDHGFLTDFYGVGLNYLELRKKACDASLDEPAIADGIRQVLKGWAPDFHHQYFSRNSFDRRWIRIHAARFHLPGSCHVLVTHDDLTLTEQMRDVQSNEHERLRLLLEVTRILPWEANFPSTSYTYVGAQAVNMLGYPLDDWYERDFWRKHLHPDDRDLAISKCMEYTKSRDHYELDYRMIAKDRRVVWLHNLVTVIRENNEPKMIRGFSIDVTENKQTQAALTDMSGRLISAQEDERKRVARELHDDLNQRMALLSIELEQLGQMKEPFDLHARLDELQNQAQEISADIHRISYRLHPSKLDHLGLAAAVKSLCQELSAKRTIKIEFQQTGFPAHLPQDVTLCVFRIAQEAVRNCVKHSGAGTVRVKLENTGKEILLSVSDNGCGFDTDSEAMTKGLGFTSMRERLRILNGEMQIESHAMKGTHITVSVPTAH